MQSLHGSITDNQNGSILIAIVVTMVMVSVLAAGLLSINSTASFNQTGSNSSSNAFHLAEAGYRYVLSHVADYATIDDQTFTLNTGNRFKITLKPYDFDIQASSTATQIQTLIPYGNVPFANVTTPGTIAVAGTPYTYLTIDVTGSAVDFYIPGGVTLPISGKVQLAALINGDTTITENSTFSVKSPNPNPLNLFPANHGTFTVGSNHYQYRSRTENTLIDITAADGPWPGNATLSDGDPVILDRFIELESMGIYGSGPLSSQSLLTYHIPLDNGEAGGGGEPIEDFEDTVDWSPNEGTGSTGEGTFAVTNDEDDSTNKVLVITAPTVIDGGLRKWYVSSIDYNWQTNGPDLDDIWRTAGYLLSYEAQIKIKVNDPDTTTYPEGFQNMSDNFFYLAGINFRKQAYGNSYGLSFFRAERRGYDGIPDSLNPIDGWNSGGRAMVLLWERIGTDMDDWRWLAYANLSDVNSMQEQNVIFADDFEFGIGNWTVSLDGFGLETVTGHDGSLSQIITDSPGSGVDPDVDYSGNSEYQITSNPIDITGQTTLIFSFWHRYRTENNDDICEVEVRFNGNSGTWLSLDTYYNRQRSWEYIEFDLGTNLPANSIEIRFTLKTDNRRNYDGWRIDDVQVQVQEPTLTPKWMTLMLRLEEIYLTPTTKTNQIKAYISDETVHGPANTIAQDNNRLNNIIGEANWPPDDVDNTNSTNDHFTLIRWDGINNDVTLTGIGNELESIIEVSTITSPSSGADTGPGSFAEPEIGLHSWGWNYNNIYFDDFSIQTN